MLKKEGSRIEGTPAAVAPLIGANRILSALPLHCTALFLGAFLLFAIQPMFTKMILPLLGGTPAIWNTAVMFFQGMLLSGYLYAHLLSRLSRLRWQVLMHGSVLALGLLFLPVHPAWSEAPSGGVRPVPWLVGLLTVSIGLPFFAVSATAPLLQRWFSRSGHPRASDPYFLYVSSNIGGLLALLAYPVLIEPLVGLKLQSRAWAAGYVLLALAIVLCSISLRAWYGLRPATLPKPAPGPDRTVALSRRITWDSRAHWVVLSFVPSALLLAVTLHISTDVASAPFLWVAPLSLYMLSFIIVFARRPILKHKWMLLLQLVVYALLAVYFTRMTLLPLLALHLAALFVTAMVCHGELVRLRPAAEHLTEFYLWMSVGGLLGGVFCVLVAPVLFNSVLEYPLVLTLGCLLRPGSTGGGRRQYLLDVLLPGLFALLFFFLQAFLDFGVFKFLGAASNWLLFVVALLAFYSFRHRPLRLALAFAPLIFGLIFLDDVSRQLLRRRSFFGVYTVSADKERQTHYLYHGNIIHGSQRMEPATISTPTGYYCEDGPLGQVFAAVGTARKLRHIGCIGLGTGTTACYRQPGQRLTFFEVDPVIERIARNPDLFRYLEPGGQDVEVILGDGRQNVSRMPDGTFDLLILDAFSSDAIPAHLLTREALAIYLRKLVPGGIAVFHISNQYVRLEPVVANLVADAGLSALIQDYEPDSEDTTEVERLSSTWVVVARNDADLACLEGDDRWRPLEPDARVGIWTDDYSNLFKILMW